MLFVVKGRECCVCLLCLVQVNVEPGGEVVDEGTLLQSGFELPEGLAVEGREAGLADAPGCCYLREGAAFGVESVGQGNDLSFTGLEALEGVVDAAKLSGAEQLVVLPLAEELGKLEITD